MNLDNKINEEKQFKARIAFMGQPRDNDPRACYVVLEDDVITSRRVEYDVDATAQKIYETPDLDDMLGDRLRTGR